MNHLPGVAILGCGLIGQKRSQTLTGAKLVICADVDEKASEVACRGISRLQSNWRLAYRDPASDVDVVIVATTNNALVETSLAAIEAGKHVLVEKPAARNVAELDQLIEAGIKK